MLSSPSWYPAIFQRTSRRSFRSDAPLTADESARLESAALAFRPFPEARVAFIRKPPDAVLRGIIGAYGRISGAPAFAAMIGRGDGPYVAERVGYTGQAFILEATALGLGTCWVSGMFRPGSVGRETLLEAGEKVFAVTPIGRPVERLTAKDRIFKALARSAQRKPLSETASGTPPSPWQTQALEAARLAPSAANRQPWRFETGPEAIIVSVAGGIDSGRYPKRLDCGIAMLHLELGARAGGAAGAWTPLAAPEVACYAVGRR
ncbi:MAG: nitroreductase family protein [Candidatus Aminicenantes bacterium]|nr:nitroreductase family protein [Candidatus Aminicenantes bacterium]